MITKVTEKNSKKYRKLFDEASELLGCKKVVAQDKDGKPLIDEDGNEILVLDKTDGNYISDLYEYFIAFPLIIAAAKELGKDEKENPSGDPDYWTKYYTILPLDEPVFEVNADTRKIEIPSEFKTIGMAGDNAAEIVFFLIDRFFDAMDFGAKEVIAAIEWQRTTGSNPVGDSDKAYIKELTLYDNKVLIGWVIDKEITAEPGTIEFALKLYTLKNDSDKEIAYSFNTQPAKVTIGKTLNFHPETSGDLDDEPIASVINRIINTTSPDNLWGDNTLIPPTFITNIGSFVNSNDPNNIVYAYTKNSPSGEYYADLNPDTFVATVKAESNNSTDNINYQWYKYDESTNIWRKDGAEAPEMTDINNPENSGGGNVKELTETGIYKCVAIDNVRGYRRSLKDSEILYILQPEKPVVKAYENENTKYYSVILNGESASLDVKPGLSDNKFITYQYDEGEKTEISYIWKKANSLTEPKQLIDNIITKDYEVTEEGFYFGSAKTTRNKKSKESNEATTYRVTKSLVAPGEDNYRLDEDFSGSGSLMGKLGETIKIIIENYDYDTLEYQWYITNDLLTVPLQYNLVETEGGSGVAIGGVIEFKPKITGYYKINIKVHRNGQIYPDTDKDITEQDVGYELLRRDGKPVYIAIQSK